MADDLPFEIDNPMDYSWTLAAHDAMRDGRLRAAVTRAGHIGFAKIWGACPRCDHEIEFSLALDLISSVGGLLGPETSRTGGNAPIDVVCNCSTPHADAPAHKRGCGVAFRVLVKTGTHD